MTPSRALSSFALALLLGLTAGGAPAAIASPALPAFASTSNSPASPPGAAGAATAAGAARAADGLRIHIGSFNIRADRSTRTFARAVAAFRRHVEVAGLQEVNTGHKTRALKRMKGWRSYRPAQLQQNPVIWRADEFDRVAARGVKIATARSIGHEDVPHYRHAQFATVVRLEHRATGRSISVINTHPVNGAVNGGRCIKNHPRLCELYKDSIAGLARAVVREKQLTDGRVFVLGDLNDNYPEDRTHHQRPLAYAQLARLGLVAHWEARAEIRPHEGSGARGGAYLDQIWGPVLPGAIDVLHAITASDHYPITATYAVAPAPPG